jgi:hypothetical protein
VKSDINTVQSAAPYPSHAGNAIKSKVTGDVQTAKRAANDATPSSNELQNAASAAQRKVSGDVNGRKSALNSTLLSVHGGFFGTHPKQQANAINCKTVQKVCVCLFVSYVTRHLMHALTNLVTTK